MAHTLNLKESGIKALLKAHDRGTLRPTDHTLIQLVAACRAMATIANELAVTFEPLLPNTDALLINYLTGSEPITSEITEAILDRLMQSPVVMEAIKKQVGYLHFGTAVMSGLLGIDPTDYEPELN